MMLRVLFATSNILISLVLGALALAYVGINDPQTLSLLLSWARSLKAMIVGLGIAPKYNIWIELLLEERQLLFMLFTIAARIALAIVTSIFLSVFGPASDRRHRDA
jgi:hypothetical protein